MNEMKETIKILKTRWLEVAFLISISFLTSFLIGITKTYQLNRSWMAVVCFGLFFIEIIIYLGFLRTVSLEGQHRQSPLNLFREGKQFLLRFIGLGLLYAIVLIILVQLIFWIIKMAMSIGGNLKEVAPVIPRLCWFIVNLILIKPYLFIPALIIVLDCRVFESFRFLRQCKLFNAKGLLVIYGVQIISPVVWLLLTESMELTPFQQTVLGLSYFVIWQLLTLIIFVMSVGFIASQNLAYDNYPDLLYTEDN